MSSNEPSSAMRAGCMPIIISPGSIGIVISDSPVGSDAAIAGSSTMRPLAVDGFAPTRRRSAMSSPVAVILTVAVSVGPPGPNDCARSV